MLLRALIGLVVGLLSITAHAGLVGTGSNTGAGTTMTVNLPGGAVAGQQAVLCFQHDNSSATTTWHTGFTQFTADLVMTAEGGRSGCAWKRLSSGDISGVTLTVTTSNGTQDWVLGLAVFSNRHASTDPSAVATEHDTLETTPVSVAADGVNATAGDDLLWVSAPDVNGSGIALGHTVPSGYTEQFDTENNWANLCFATLLNVSAGATGTQTGTLDLTSANSAWGAYLIRLPVDAGGGGSSISVITFHRRQMFKH